MALFRLLFRTRALSSQQIAELETANTNAGNQALPIIARLLTAKHSAQYPNAVATQVNPTYATATLVFSSTGPANAQTVSICGTTFTAATSPSGANDFQRSDTAATAAANLATLLNTVSGANRPKVNASITASANGGATLTLTAKEPGVLANGLHVAAVGTFANVVITNFAGGSNGTETTI